MILIRSEIILDKRFRTLPYFLLSNLKKCGTNIILYAEGVCEMSKAKTTEQFKKELFNICGDEYEVLGEYVNCKTNIKVRHKICDYEFEPNPDNLLSRKSKCPKCNGVPRKDTEYFKREVCDRVGNEYKVLSEYKGTHEHVLMRHDVDYCGYEWDVECNAFLKGSRCPKCAGNAKRTDESFKEEVYNLIGDEYIFFEEYINSQTKIKCRHNKPDCGYEWSTYPESFIVGHRCPKCQGCARKDTDIFKQEVYDLVGDEYIVLSDYIDSHQKILMKHNIENCGFAYPVSPGHFLIGRRCPKCYGKFRRTTQEFKDKVYQLVNDEYAVLGEYIDSFTKMLFEHKQCGYKSLISPTDFINGCRCHKCTKSTKSRTTETFRMQVYDLVSDEYEVLGEYKKAIIPIQMKHNLCGNTYEAAPSNFLSGRRCPQCNESNNESAIRMFLQQNDINFETQYKFDNCKNIRSLPFDFAIFDCNNNLKYLIEYDGEHHYRPVMFGGMSEEEAIRQHKVTKHNDKVKNKYCEKNNINLIRIPYWESKNINQILSDLLLS
jgi:hypothetical protein